MVFQHIENLQQEYTDKYVVVDDEQPELQRFNGMTGVVRTVNMNGRALVEFDGDNNIGWYDIDIDFLRVIDEPLPETVAEEQPPAAKQEEKEDKAPSELKKAREKDSGEMSVDEILAAAKSEPATDTAEQTGTADTDASSMSVDDILSAARADTPATSETASEDESPAAEEAAPAAVKAADTSAMSVDDILSAARADSGEESVVATETVTPEEVAAEPASEEDTAEQQTAGGDEPAAAEGELPTDVDGMIAYCQRVDGK